MEKEEAKFIIEAIADHCCCEKCAHAVLQQFWLKFPEHRDLIRPIYKSYFTYDFTINEDDENE